MFAKFRALALCFMSFILCCTLTGCMDAVMDYLQPGYSKPATGLQSQNTQGQEQEDNQDETKPVVTDTKPTAESTAPTATTEPVQKEEEKEEEKDEEEEKEEEEEEEEDTSEDLFGYITGEPLNVRTGPGKEYEVVDTLSINDTVYIREVQDGWGRTDKGWISMDYFSTEPVDTKKEEEKPADTVVRTGTITGEPLHIRTGPGKEYESVGYLYKGDTVEILEIKDNWGRIEKGWISMDYVG